MTFIDGLAVDRFVAFDDGQSVMTAAVNNNVAGIDGECGGEMSCGTCHVYVDADWMDQLVPVSDEEQEMLDVVEEPRENSRLGCQIALGPVLDGLRVVVAEQLS